VLDRRKFVSGMALGFVALPLAVNAQQPTKLARVGYLVLSSLESPELRATIDAFRQGLRERGYVEGRNIIIEFRAADNKIERLPDLAGELVRLKVDVIVTTSSLTARAVQRATTTIPIVVPIMDDPVGDGLVASLARPGGNITGLTFLWPELVPKRLALLKEAVPTISRLAILWHPGIHGERTTSDVMKKTEAAARTLGVQLRFVAVQGAAELDEAFSTMTREHVDALMLFPSSMLFLERKRIVDLAAKHRLPSMYATRQYVDLGGLISYGANQADLIRRAATYVDKILKGANPGELPVEQPTKFELLINLKTAKALGLAIPQSVLTHADEVIQ